MTARTSEAMMRAMRLVRKGMSPYAAAKKVKIALSTMYRSELYKAWKKEQTK